MSNFTIHHVLICSILLLCSCDKQTNTTIPSTNRNNTTNSSYSKKRIYDKNGKTEKIVVEFPKNIDGKTYSLKIILSNLDENEINRLNRILKKAVSDDLLSLEELISFYIEGSIIECSKDDLEIIKQKIQQSLDDNFIDAKEMKTIRGYIIEKNPMHSIFKRSNTQ